MTGLLAFITSPLGRWVLIGLAFLAWTAYQRDQAADRARQECQAEQLQKTVDELQRQRDAAEAARKAAEEQAHVIGLSILSGSHMPLVAEVLACMRKAGLSVPLIVGGIIPEDDAETLRGMGVAAVYTPKDFELNRIMLDIVGLVDPQPVAAE